VLLQIEWRPSAGYKSASQRARVATEAWAQANLYCPSCDSRRLAPAPVNTPAIDFLCPKCGSPFQLKSQSRSFALRVTDAAYEAMRRAILEYRTPNLLLLHYLPHSWRVQNLVLVPRFAFSTSALERRNPLGPGARRAGWVGCNILLKRIPPDARIPIVEDGVVAAAREVRNRYRMLRPLEGMGAEKRGWTLDVLNVVRQLARREFSLSDVYASEDVLADLHPRNLHVRDKIRQQLQILRDMRIIEFLGRGRYRLR
jgi:type II restriction enzyme